MGPEQGEDAKKLMYIWVWSPQTEEITKKKGIFDLSMFPAIGWPNGAYFHLQSVQMSLPSGQTNITSGFQLFTELKKKKKDHF